MKKIKKRLTATLLACSLPFILLLSGCDAPGGSDGGRLSIVCTIFPQYDWVREILGDEVENMDLNLLLANKADIHNYQPSVDDIVKISNCDLFIYVGGESDEWVEDALKEATNPDMKVINLLETLGNGVWEEEILEGMQDDGHDHGAEEEHVEGEDAEHEEEHAEGEDAEHEEEHAEGEDAEHEEEHVEGEDAEHEEEHVEGEDAEHEEEHVEDEGAEHEEEHEHEEGALDEHVWLSLKNARIFCDEITEVLTSLDEDHADIYIDNLSVYVDKLAALDMEYSSVVGEAPIRTLLFGDRFPFRYMIEDYGLSYYAAFPGCSAETEASFETMIFLAGKVDELNLKTVMVTETADQSIANTIIDNTKTKDQQILMLNAMQSITKDNLEDGTTYLSIMEDNMATLKEALQ